MVIGMLVQLSSLERSLGWKKPGFIRFAGSSIIAVLLILVDTVDEVDES